MKLNMHHTTVIQATMISVVNYTSAAVLWLSDLKEWLALGLVVMNIVSVCYVIRFNRRRLRELEVKKTIKDKDD